MSKRKEPSSTNPPPPNKAEQALKVMLNWSGLTPRDQHAIRELKKVRQMRWDEYESAVAAWLEVKRRGLDESRAEQQAHAALNLHDAADRAVQDKYKDMDTKSRATNKISLLTQGLSDATRPLFRKAMHSGRNGFSDRVEAPRGTLYNNEGVMYTPENSLFTALQRQYARRHVANLGKEHPSPVVQENNKRARSNNLEQDKIEESSEDQDRDYLPLKKDAY